MSTLPDKPSELIRVALKDLWKARRNPKYKIAMDEAYHSPNGVCTICFAGAVMAQSLGASPREHLDPSQFDKDTEQKLEALDNFRCGHAYYGFEAMGLGITSGIPWRFEVCRYDSSATQFKRDMLAMAKTLEEAGL